MRRRIGLPLPNMAAMREDPAQVGGEIAERVRAMIGTQDANVVAKWFLTFATDALLRLGHPPELIHDWVIEATDAHEVRSTSRIIHS